MEENVLVLTPADIGGKNTQEEDQVRIWAAPHSRSRDQHSVGGPPREGRWAVAPSEGRDSDSSDSRKTSAVLMF